MKEGKVVLRAEKVSHLSVGEGGENGVFTVPSFGASFQVS